MSGLAHERFSYLGRSWSMLTRDEGWIKPVLLLSVALFVPFIGWFAVLGYGLEWARLTAWNIDAVPKQRNVDIGGCIKSGARAFVVFVTYEIVFLVISAILILAGLFISVDLTRIFQIIFLIVQQFFIVLVLAAALHAALYQRLRAAYAVKRIYSMVRFDVRGLMRIVAIFMTCVLCVSGVTAFFYTHVLPFWTRALTFSIGVKRFSIGIMRDPNFALLSDWSLCVYVFSMIIGVIGFLLVINALGLWMRQFDVAQWGSPTSVIEGLQTKSPEAGGSSADFSPSGVAPACAVASAGVGSAASSTAGSASPAAGSATPPAAGSAAPRPVDSVASCTADVVSNGSNESETCGSCCTCGANGGAGKNHNMTDVTSDTSTEGIEDMTKLERGSSAE